MTERPTSRANDVAARPADAYSQAAAGWATGAALVYQPLADALVARAPHGLDDRLVLDACAGTGCGESALLAAGARVVATDLSEGMLRYRRAQRAQRAPGAVSDVCRLALRTGSVDDAILPFVLNHLPEPADALVETARAVRTGGAVLATTFSDASKSTARDRIDEIAIEEGFQPPQWYVDLRDSYASGVGTPDLLAACATRAGLGEIQVEEAQVETGLTDPAALVEYRLSMAQYATWIAELDDIGLQRLRRRAIDAAAAQMAPYRPIVLFLVARSA